MTKLIVFCTAVSCLSVVALVGARPASAQTACTPYSIGVPILQVLKEPDSPGDYVGVLQQGDIACVRDDEKVGPQQLSYVVEKTEASGTVVAVGGWASTLFMSSEAGAETADTGTSTETVAMNEGDILRFIAPVPFGPPAVRGKSLKELAEGTPMFPPIEGLPKDLWQKTCTTCHQWTAERLCDQGKSYIPRAAAVFRHQHPYGGPYKLALMRWAKTGCE
jgi:hypothetical protein